MWRREAAAKGREERFITEYVRATQPMLYAEAVEFHNKLREKYPNKMDLRRVPEVSQLQPKKTCPLFKDNLELRIPLLPSTQDTPSTASTTSTVPSTASTTSTVPSTTSTVSSTVHDTPCTVPSTASTTSTVSSTVHDTPCTVSSTVHDTPCTTSVPEPLLDDSTVKQIIEELQNDPQLNTFFDYMDIDIPDIDIPDMSLLEQELLSVN